MSTYDDSIRFMPDSEAPFVVPAPRRFRTWDLIGAALSWLLILAIVGFKFVAPQFGAPVTAESEGPELTFDLQARYLVGAAQVQGAATRSASLNQLTNSSASEARRLREIVLAGELGDADAALKRLKNDQQDQPNQIASILRRLYGDYKDKRWDAPNVTPGEKQTLRRQLGWYGDLALAPEGSPDQQAREAALAPAQRTFVVFVTAVVVGVAILGVGTMSLLVLLVAWMLKRVRSGLHLGIGHSAIWVETFALYMFFYLGMGIVVSMLGLSTVNRLVLSGPLALVSLAVLFWARIRGLSWADIRRDVGWTTGRGLAREIMAGPATYVMAVPFAAIGVMITLLLTLLSRKVAGGTPGKAPVHPVAPILPGAGIELKLMIFLLAVVIAPIVEETMFRGVFYRHLREGTRKLGGVASFLLSALVTSFVFAAVHPQGWRGIPALMGIAMGLNLAREWRGSLIPSMIAHGINNGLVMTVLLVAMS